MRYYKEVINPNLEDENYLFVITNIKKKIRIAKIRTNSYELHNETKPWPIPKTPMDEIICHVCDANMEDEKHLILEDPTYTH